MKKLATIFLLITGSFSYGQQVIDIRLGPSAGSTVDTIPLSNRIDAKQNILVSGTNIKTVNGQTLVAGGNLVVTATADPEANFYLSNSGNDGNSGLTKALAKRSLKSIDTLINASSLTSIKVGIEGGGVWNEQGDKLLRAGVSFFPYNRSEAPNKNPMPKFIGTTIHNTGWTLSGSYTYSKSITHTINVGESILNGYSWMYVIEIDTLLEKTAPLTARKYLRWVISQAAVDTTVGSYWGPTSTPSASPSMMYIHTSDNSSPNNNTKYRYEVVTKQDVFNKRLDMILYYGQKLSFSDMAIMDYGTGVGPIGSEMDSTTESGMYFQGNSIHINVLGNSSSINGCAFVDGDPLIEGGQVVIYKTIGNDETNAIKNSIFLKGQTGAFTHTSGTLPNHGKYLIENDYFYNYYGYAIQGENTDTLDVNYCYADTVSKFVNSHARLVLVRNSAVRSGEFFGYENSNSIVYNCLFRSRTKNLATGFIHGAGLGNKLRVTNSIIHIKNTVPVGAEGGVVFNNRGDTSSRLTSKYNIIVIDGVSGSYITINTQNSQDGVGTNKDTLDYNAYILLNGFPTWSNYGGASKYFTLPNWQAASGQDAHSIFIDLRLYEGDLKRIFVDPDAGNYTLTNSPQADSIRAIGAGMPSPLTKWSPLPSREQVYSMVDTKTIPLVSTLFSGSSAADNYIKVERMTTTQRTATYPSAGRHVFDTTTNKEYTGDGTSWNALW